MAMKIKIEVVIDGAEIDMDSYFPSTGATSPEQAVMADLDMYRSGEAALEDIIYQYGDNSDIEVNLVGVYDNLNDCANGEVIHTEEGE